MKKITSIILLLLLTVVIFGQQSDKQFNTVDDYFNQAASQYIFKDNIGALKTIEQGLKIEPENQKLIKLAELIMQQNKDQNKQQNKQQNKDQQNKDKQQQQQQQQNKEEKEKKMQQQPSPENISPEDAERLLRAIQEEDKELQKKLKKEKANAQKVQTEKDW